MNKRLQIQIYFKTVILNLFQDPVGISETLDTPNKMRAVLLFFPKMNNRKNIAYIQTWITQDKRK